MMNTLSLPLKILMIIKWFCNSDTRIFFKTFVLIQFSLEGAIGKIHAVLLENKGQKDVNDKLLTELRLVATSGGFSPEFRYWVLICGLFNGDGSRNIVKSWKDHEKAFLTLVQQDGKIGIKHLLQSIILFFVRRHEE